MSFVCNICLDTLQTRGYTPQVKDKTPPIYYHQTLDHHYSFQSFEKSVKEGCFICASMWREQSDVWREEMQNRHRAINQDRRFTKMRTTWKHGTIVYFGPLFCGIEVLHICEFQPMNTPVTPLVSDTTSSKELLQVAQTWLQRCLQHHKACNRDKAGNPWYPTRLLHLGGVDQSELNIRLIHTVDEHLVGPYMTLSHRWGGSNILKLTRDTLPMFCKKIVFEDMPKTFRDAAVISKSLGIQYLWIDSLCIIQGEGDLLDWFHESALMHKVYTFSYCNLSATVSEDSSQGLFRSRDPTRSFCSPKIAFATRGLETDPTPIKHQFVDAGIWKFNVDAGILNSRGWVYQERLLAPRVLHFGHDQLFWECRELQACESYPAKIPLFRTVVEAEKLRFKDILNPKTDMCTNSGRDLRRIMLGNWEKIVHTYSTKNLTQPGDKLIALSGIAKAVASLNQDTYLAGLWRTDIESQLLWTAFPRRGDLETVRRSPAYRAPTWSWASIDGVVNFNHCATRGRAMFSVEDVVLDYATEDITGCVTGGYIDLRGHLIPIELPPEKLPRKFDDSRYIRVQDSRGALRIHVYFDIILEVGNHVLGGHLFFMPAFANPRDDSKVDVILLFRLVNSKIPLFERTGVAKVIDGDLQKIGVLLSMRDDDEKKTFPCLRFENGLHTIRVI